MAFLLPQNLFVEIEAFYKKEIERLGGADLASNDDKWFVPSPTTPYESAERGPLLQYNPVGGPKYVLDRTSLYLKYEGMNFPIIDKISLFTLTKMLAIPPSKEFVIYRSLKSTIDGMRGDAEEVGKVPAGASDGERSRIFKTLIFPKIEQVYFLIQKRNKYDDIIKALLKNWWTANSESLFDSYMSLAEASEIKKRGAIGELPEIKIPGVEGSNENVQAKFTTVNLYDLFSVMIAPAMTDSATKLMEALGFSDWLRDHAEKSADILGRDVLLTLDGLQKAQKGDVARFSKIVATALDLPTDLTEGDLNQLNQCALITALVHDDPRWNFRKYIQNSKYKSPLGATEPGNKRIYPVQIDNYNPNKLINNCVINKNVKTIFNTSDTKTPHNMVKGIFWVYEDNKDSLREAELSTNSTVHKKKISTVFNSTVQGDEETFRERFRFATLDRIKDSSYYFLENTKINFDGTNPSTARNDVKVEMSWKLGSLEGLDSTLAILGIRDGLDMDTTITIKDLITLPITKKPSASDGPGQFITNQYSPNYSRLRLKVAPYGDKNGDHQNDCMILDLAIIDHQINRSSETGETTLKVNYRGYFEATLNMPFNDALASPKVIESREKRQSKTLDKLLTNDCDPKLVREALRLEQESYGIESSNPSSGTLLLRLQNKGLIHKYELDRNKMIAGIFGNVLDGRQMYVANVKPQNSPMLGKDEKEALSDIAFDRDVDKEGDEVEAGVSSVGKLALAIISPVIGQAYLAAQNKGLLDETSEDDAKRKSLLKKIDKKFFFLGDLMYVLLDCLYKSSPPSDVHRDHLKNLNLRFVMGTIYVPDPKNLGGPPKIINPISIPVDLKFFVQWFNATIVSKGLTNYPVGVFIRDLVERLINDVIYDTCFSLLLPDENPPLLRSRTFVSSDTDWFKKDKGWFNPNSPFGGDPTDILFPKAFVSNKTSNDNTWSHEITSKNYCVIYQQFPSYKRQLAAEKNGYLRDDEYTPTIYYGAKNKNYNFLSNVSFAKTNSPFLREARYFNTNYGGLSLLSNVYDLDFSFKRRKANTMFYPGCIINFVLLDWGQRWVDEPPWKTDATGGISHYFGTGKLGDSDSHTEGTMSNIMGMGGYFIVKSVEYNLGQTPGEFEINITTKFLGTDATKVLNRTAEEISQLEHSAECAEVFNVTAKRYNDLLDKNELPSIDAVIYIEPTKNTGERVEGQTNE